MDIKLVSGIWLAISKKKWERQELVFHSTQDIINAANGGRLPDKIMMTFHTQRWLDKHLPRLKELFLQNTKNVIKCLLVRAGGDASR